MTSENQVLSVVVGARWGAEMGGGYPFFRLNIYSDMLFLCPRFSIFGRKLSCSIPKKHVLEIKRTKSCCNGCGLKIIHNHMHSPPFVVIAFGRSKDVQTTEEILNELNYPIDLKAERVRLSLSEMIKEIYKNGI